MQPDSRFLLEDAFNSIKNTPLLLHFISTSSIDTSTLEYVFSYSHQTRYGAKYDYIMRINNGVEQRNVGRHGITFIDFISEGDDDVYNLIEIINPLNGTTRVIYSRPRNIQRHRTIPRRRRRN